MLRGMADHYPTLLVGAGAIGQRRAAVAAAEPRTPLVGVCDVDGAAAAQVATAHGGRAFADWRPALVETRPRVVVVATPNAFHRRIVCAALDSGAAVLTEKPFGRNADEARTMFDADPEQRRLAVGFNHRFHPAVDTLHRMVNGGAIGTVLFVRAVYGHGGRAGYDSEWRFDPSTAGGGELLDQGVHLVDLLCWLLGEPERVQSELGSLHWDGRVEDNAFALLRFAGGAIASMHASWTQWRNRYQIEVYGATGALELHGLTGSYGAPTLTLWQRQESGAPVRREIPVAAEDLSWAAQWADLVAALDDGRPPRVGGAEGLRAMRVVDALYRNAGRATRGS